MKILFVAFEFPPLGGAGVQRSIKFARYLPEFGIEPVVVTTDLASFRRVIGNPVDESLLRYLPADLVVERIPCGQPKAVAPGRFGEWRRIFFSLVEDQAKLWKANVVAAMPRLLEQHRPQAIYVSLPPFGMGPLWCEIARRHDLPLVLDFRDGWSQWCISPYGSWLHYLLTLRLERQCLTAARRVVCTSDQTRADFLRVHPHIAPDKIAVITNGYDETIADWTPDIRPPGEVFRIGYVGSFYYRPAARESMMRPWWRKRPNRMIHYAPRKEDWLYRSPYFFFRAVARLFARNPEYRKRLRIRFAGEKPDWIDAQVNEFGLADVVEFVGLLDHPSVLGFQRECDALLVTSSKVIGGLDYSIAGKTFEYLSLKKPLVGFVAAGAQKDLLTETGTALICDPDATDESAERLGALIEGRFQPRPNVRFLEQLHRRELTRRLAEVIRSAAAATVPPSR